MKMNINKSHCGPLFQVERSAKKLRKSEPLRRPTGMNREVYALLYSDTNTRWGRGVGERRWRVRDQYSDWSHCMKYLIGSQTSMCPFFILLVLFQCPSLADPHWHWVWLQTAQGTTRQETRETMEMDDLHKPCQTGQERHIFVQTKVTDVSFVLLHHQDGLQLCHWRRTTEENKEYPYAQFNKKLDIPTYSEDEYQVYCVCTVSLESCRSTYIWWTLTSQIIMWQTISTLYHGKLKHDERWDSHLTVSGVVQWYDDWLISYVCID